MTKMKKEMKLYYNSQKKRDREVLGYAEALRHFVINDRDISKANLTETQYKELADGMNAPVMELVDKNAGLYMDEMKGHDFEEEELLKLLTNNPSLVKTPIAVIGDVVYHVKSPFELIPKDLEILGVESPEGNEFEKD